MKPFASLLAVVFTLLIASPVHAQETPSWDAGQFIIKNHLHQISGFTTAGLTAATGIAALLDAREVHPILGYSTMSMGLVTLTLGLTAFSSRLDEVWPHALLMGVAETCWILNGFVLEPGSLPHKISGATSIVALSSAIVAIVLIES